MRTIVLAGACVLALAASSAKATIYGDTIGDTFFGGILDISSVEVTDDGTNINFKMTLVGDIIATNWGNYMYHISTGPGGDTDAISNPWNRPISYSPDGADVWIGNWVDGASGGSQFWQFSAGTWNQTGGTTPSITQFSHTVSYPIALLGIAPGQSFCFDAYASGAGGDPGAIDSLGNPVQQINDWNVQSNANPINCYTTTPEPGSLALLGLGALAIVRRKR